MTTIKTQTIATTLSTYAAGLTAKKYPLGSGECWKRAKATVKALNHLPLHYVKGLLHHPTEMDETGQGDHGFCVIDADGEYLIIDPMIGEYLATKGGIDEFIWEFDDDQIAYK